MFDKEYYSVYVGITPNIAELINSTLTFSEDLEGTGGNPTNRSLDISSLAGEANVYVAFRHWNSTSQDFVSIDDVTVEAENVLSVSDLNAKSTAIYPNPVKDAFQVKLSNKFNAENVTVTITDMTGKQVQTFGSASSYNVSKLPAGVYVVKITDGVNTKVQKLIKK